LNSQAISKRMI